MSALAVDPATVGRRDAGERRLFDLAGGEPTLEDVLSSAWEGLAAGAVVACPLCAGDMRAGVDPGAGGVLGRCADCGTALG